MKLAEHRITAQGFPDLVLYDSIIAPGVMLLQDGSLMASWRYRGPDMQSRTHEDMAALSARLNSIMRMGSGWMIHCDAIRSEAPGYTDSEFPFPVAKVIDDERRVQFSAEGAHYESTYYLTLTHQSALPSETRLREVMYDSPERSGSASKVLAEFEQQVSAFESVFASLFEMERLGPEEVDGVTYDGQLRYLRRVITGADHPFRLPALPSCLQDIVGAAPFAAGLEPQLDGDYLAAVAIDGFPPLSEPGLLAALDRLPLTYRWSTRAIILDPTEAYARLNEERKKWSSRRVQWLDVVLRRNGVLNEFAVEMAEDARHAMGEASSGDVHFVVYSSVVVLRDKDRGRLDEATALVVKTIRNVMGFACRVERENAVEAFRGSLPGDGYCNVRRQYLHTLNLADLLPIASVYSGALECPSALMPAHSPPLFYAATTGQTPFRFHLHVSDLGHTVAIGPSGSGKSVFLSLVTAQWFRFANARVYAFDKGYSLMTLTEACGGEFYDIGSDEQPMSFQPLGHLDQSSDRDWACGWTESLCELHSVALTPQQRYAIRRGIDLLAESPSRTITELAASIQDSAVQAVLRQYIAGPLDAASDEVGSGRFITYEIGSLLALDAKIVAPILSYLFRRITRRLQGGNGEPTLIVLDEAWAPLKLPRFQEEIRGWLKELRKLNAVVVMATQHISDITKSPIGDVILNSCPTRILLPDAEASNPATKRLYMDALGMNEREVELVQNGMPKRDYFVYSADLRAGRRVVQLGLGPVALAFCGVSGKQEINEVRAMIARHGPHWPVEWLRAKGQHEWADYLAAQTESYAASAAA